VSAPGPVAAKPFKPYPAYKDSGVEWLGEIPAHWEVKRLKHLAALSPEALLEDTDPAFEMTYVDIGGVDSLGRIVDSEQLTFAAAPSRARRLVRDGDVIVSTVRTYLRAIAPIKEPAPGMVVSTGFAVVRPDDDLTTDYAAYALRAPYFVERVVANSKGVSFPAINESEMATYELARPSEPEQRAIAAFLDRETARIDALVAKKERLIELLQEKRTALITRAVTKGLDPTVPMKDSGVEWLGEIPAHWHVKRLKHLALHPGSGIQMGPFGSMLKETAATDTGYKLYGQENTISGNFACGSRWLSHEQYCALREYWVREGDIVLTRKGSLGNARIVPATAEHGAIDSDTIRVRTDLDVVAQEFIVLLLHEARYVAEQIAAIRRGAVLGGLNTATIANLLIVVPPKVEQRFLMAGLRVGTEHVDRLIAKVRGAIDRLKELRTALISAAVTGKIDVRAASAEAPASQGGAS
jgi:type I restriction enzyme S subunit